MRRVLVAIGVAVLLTSACGSDDNPAVGNGDDSTTTTAPPPGGGGPDGTIESSTLPALTVAAGATVTIANADNVTHTLTADDGSFDTHEIAGGSEGEFVAPDEPGDYPIHCEIHPSMTGSLTVE